MLVLNCDFNHIVNILSSYNMTNVYRLILYLSDNAQLNNCFLTKQFMFQIMFLGGANKLLLVSLIEWIDN